MPDYQIYDIKKDAVDLSKMEMPINYSIPPQKTDHFTRNRLEMYITICDNFWLMFKSAKKSDLYLPAR